MKKITCALVILCLTVSLAACGGSDSKEKQRKNETAAHVKNARTSKNVRNTEPSAAPSSNKTATVDPNTAKRQPYSGYWTSTGDPSHSITIRPTGILYNEGMGSYGQLAWSNKLTTRGNRIIIKKAPLIGGGGQAAGFVTQTMTLSKDKKTLRVSENTAFNSPKEKDNAWAQYYARFNKNYSGTFKKVEPRSGKTASTGAQPSDDKKTQVSGDFGYSGIWSNTKKSFNEYYEDQFTDHGPTEPIQNVTIEMPVYNVVNISIENILGNRQAPATMNHTVAIDLKGRGQFHFVDSFQNKGGIAKFQLKDNRIYYDIHYSIKPKNPSIPEGAHVLSLRRGG